MSQIEQQPLAGTNAGSQRSCTRSSDDGSTLDSRKAELELLVIRTFHKLLLPSIETLVRKIVREETGLVQERVLTSLNQNSGSKINHSEPRILQLKFLNNPGLLVWTGTKITGEDGISLKVALVDAFTGEVVSSGPEASARVEIGVVHVNSDGAEEFNQHTLLLSGDTRVNLKDGVVSVGKISFPHKKKYAKKCQLMLGARIVGNFDGAGVQEAKSEPFILDDRRNALYKKHYPPSLPDEVWRLKNIGRGGSFDKRLSQNNIKTVEEFLTLYFTDCEGLQEILGSNITDKMLKETVEHGLTCELDKRYVYRPPGSTKGVVFNVVGQALGVVRDSHYVPIGNLSEEAKGDAQKLVVSAFKPGVELVPYDESCLLSSSSLSVNEPSSSNASLPKCCSFNRYVCSPHGSALTSEEAYNVVGQTVGVVPENASICDLSGIEKGAGQKLSVSVYRHGKELAVHDEMNLPESSTNLASSNSEVMEESFSFGNIVSCTSFMENDTSSSRSFERMDSVEMFNSCDMDFFRDFMRSCDDEAASPRTVSIAAQRFAREMLMKIRKPGHVPKRQRVN